MAGGTLLDRIAGLAFVIIGVGAILHARSLSVAFAADPVGPKVFPIIVGAIMVVSGAVIAIKPSRVEWEAGRWQRVVIVAIASLIYPELLVPLGFVAASILLMIVIARALDGTWLASVVSSVVTAVVIYFLIDTLLGLPLPAGPWGF